LFCGGSEPGIGAVGNGAFGVGAADAEGWSSSFACGGLESSDFGADFASSLSIGRVISCGAGEDLSADGSDFSLLSDITVGDGNGPSVRSDNSSCPSIEGAGIGCGMPDRDVLYCMGIAFMGGSEFMDGVEPLHELQPPPLEQPV
jgi:hypothetical protein